MPQLTFRTLEQAVSDFRSFHTEVGDTITYKVVYDWEKSIVSVQLSCRGKTEELIYEVLDLVVEGLDFKEVERVGIPEKNTVGVIEFVTVQTFARDVLRARLMSYFERRGYKFEAEVTTLDKTDKKVVAERLASRVPFQPETTLAQEYQTLLAKLVKKNTPKQAPKRLPEEDEGNK